MTRYVNIRSNGVKRLLKASEFKTQEMRELINSLAPQVLNKTLEMEQAGFQIYRKLGLQPPSRGSHWMWKSAARFNGIEPWASHKLRKEKKNDPIVLTTDGIKLKSEVKRTRKPVVKNFIKLKAGKKIPVSEVTTIEMNEFMISLCKKVNDNLIGEMEAGREVYKKLNIQSPSSGTFWIFKQIAKLNKIEPWYSQKLRTKKEDVTQEEKQALRNPQIHLPSDFLTRIKNMESSIHSLEQIKDDYFTLKNQFEDMKVSLDLLMDSVSKIHAAEGVHVTAETNKEIVLRIPSNIFFKQAAIVEDAKIEDFIRDKKIVFVGPESTQIRNLTERLQGAILYFFTGKDVSEQKMLLEKCENSDLIVVWPRFTGHWATGCTRKFKEKRITTRSAGVKTTVDEILERLKWN